MAERRDTKTIKTDYLARVEGEGAMLVRIEDGRVDEVKLNIYEPPRFFEAFLRGRAVHRGARHHRPHLRHLPGRVPDELGAGDGGRPAASRSAASCARSGGSSTAASGSRATRSTSSCSTRRTSSATTARSSWRATTPTSSRSALELKKTGNELMTVVGGREVHPINVRVGGWYRAPREARARAARSTSSSGRARSRSRRSRITAGFDFPDYEQDYELVALDEPGEYPIDRGRIVSSRGLDIAVSGVRRALRRGARPVVERAPLAAASSAAPTSAARSPASRSPPTGSRRSRARRRRRPDSSRRSATRSAASSCARVELVYAADEALRLIAEYEEPDAPAVEVEPRAGIGHGCTEAPRGILYHRYELDDEGTILDAQDRAADVAEPADDRGGPARRRRALARRPRRRAGAPLRADDPQLRPLHLVRDALPDARGRAHAEGRLRRESLAQRRRSRAGGGRPSARARCRRRSSCSSTRVSRRR